LSLLLSVDISNNYYYTKMLVDNDNVTSFNQTVLKV